MAYIGIKPAESFTSFATQTFSTSATSSYTLDHAVTNENELALFINNVRQQPGSGKAYTATGTALTLSANTASTDTMYAIFLGRALQTVNPADGSVATASIAATAVTGAKLNTDVISAQTALAAEPADTDEFLVSDAGVLKRIDYSLIKGGGTHVLLSTTTASDSANISITSNIDSTYNTYMLDFVNIKAADNAQTLFMRMAEGGSFVTGSSYDYGFRRLQSNAASETQGENQTKIELFNVYSNASNANLNGRMFLYSPSSSTFDTYVDFRLTGQIDGDHQMTTVGGGRSERAGAVDGVQFLFTTGNISSGSIKLYGIT